MASPGIETIHIGVDIEVPVGIFVLLPPRASCKAEQLSPSNGRLLEALDTAPFRTRDGMTE